MLKFKPEIDGEFMYIREGWCKDPNDQEFSYTRGEWCGNRRLKTGDIVTVKHIPG